MIAEPLVAELAMQLIIFFQHSVHTKSNVVLRCVIVFNWMLMRIPATAGFSTLAILVNASVDKSMRGTLNGIMMTAG